MNSPNPSRTPADAVLTLELRAAIDAQRGGDPQGAERRFARLLERHPDHPLVVHYAGLNLHLLGRREEGLALLRRSTELAPAEAGFWRNLAGALHETSRTDECARALARALALEPGHPPTLVQLARLELERGRWPEAAELFRRLAASPLAPAERAQCLVGRALALSAMSLHDEALASLTQALALAPRDPAIRLQLGEAALSAGDHEKARTAFAEAARLAPEDEPPRTGLAAILIEEGRFEEARRNLHEVTTRHPEAFRPRALLLTIDDGGEETDLEAQRAWARRDDLPWTDDPHASTFLLALGGACERRGHDEEAFADYTRGNRLRYRPERYNAAGEARYMRDCLLAADEAFRRRHTPEPFTPPPFTPVYIVGMPRSGTSLMEQMLAAHPLVAAGGEMSAFHALLLRELTLPHLGELPARLAGLNPEELEPLRAKTYGLLERTASGRPFVTDKMPGNYLYLGLLRTLAPHLRILHMRRDARDTCLSCYTTAFRYGHEFSYDLTALGQHYRAYQHVVAYWREHLPPSLFLDVDYEELVSRPEPTLKRILDFLGLPWDPRLLEFHRLERPVRTASVYQVRQPLNRRSVERWRRFAPWLGPLEEALGLRYPLPPPFTLPPETRP